MRNVRILTGTKSLSLVLLFLFLRPLCVLSQEDSLKVTLNLKNVSLKTLFEEIQRQTEYSFVYNSKDANEMTSITVAVEKQSIKSVLDKVFENSDFIYKVEGRIISVKFQPKTKVGTGGNEQKEKPKKVSGRVTDSKDQPIPGVNVWVKGTNLGTVSNDEGLFALSIPSDSQYQLRFSFMGLKTLELAYEGQAFLNVKMEEDIAELSEVSVVANGMFTRNTETFTGAVTTFQKEDLMRVSNQNVFVGLQSLDPAFNIIEDVDFGNDPNRLPDIQVRGATSLSVDIEGEYENSPNQPLFILNGFETSLEKIYDMDMNLVNSITLLKDAAAKAIYGSKAANGVVVIETVQPERGKLRASYSSSLDITVPDLTSYNLTNARQKLQAEVLAGKYTSTNAYTQAGLTQEYNELYKEVERGVNTYWMAKPLRTGVGQKHSLYLDGGDDAMRYSASLAYNNVEGVMKGSTRKTITGNITLSYRFKKLSFRNNLTIDNNEAANSPYGSFADYSRMNPYYRLRDENGNLIKQYTTSVYNPLYNAQLNSKNENRYTHITENFYGEWSINPNLRLTARVGFSRNITQSDVFKPASHTDYANILPSSDEYLLRGQYNLNNGKSTSLMANTGISYVFKRGEHVLYTNLVYDVEQSTNETSGMTAVGFPSDKMDYISFGSQYVEGGSPSGSENTLRSVGVIGAANYSFDNRYLADASYRLNGSSMFGAKERWGSFWSLGLGWNIHEEDFMKDESFFQMLKLRGSLGYTGSQSFNTYQAISTYSYITDKTYNGDMGVILLGLANENLKWQQVYDRNIGVDASIFRSRLSLRAEYYNSTTTNLLTDVTLPPSAGFSSYRENLGEILNTGYELSANYRFWSNPATRSSINVFFNFNYNKNEISKISDALRKINEAQDEEKETGGATEEEVTAQQTPSIRYEEGQSLTAIWAVRSLGIDPVTGREVFLKKDGTTTYEWSTADQVVVGDGTPKYRGSLGANIRHKGFDLNLNFSYKLGGQTYNSTLVNKVENVDVYNNNVDLRVLTGRWNTPGVPAKFKSISDQSVTKPTSRFVYDLNELILNSITVSYDFSQQKWLKKSPFEYLRIGFNMNDIARITSVKQEYGLEYPRARVFSFNLQSRF